MKKYNKASFDDVLNEHDSVLILSWSDWENERPSNRWHYSRRLNRKRPVFFVNKPNGPRTINCNIDSIDSEFNFCIITPSLNLTYNEILVQVKEILAVDGFFRPLIWIYNAFYDDFDSVFQDSIAIYHATEDYFDLNVFPESNLIRNAIIDLSEKIDNLFSGSYSLESILSNAISDIEKKNSPLTIGKQFHELLRTH